MFVISLWNSLPKIKVQFSSTKITVKIRLLESTAEMALTSTGQIAKVEKKIYSTGKNSFVCLFVF